MLELEENLHYSLLLDMYSPLLTDKQSKVLKSFFNDNLGLSEIASLHDVSRQAVRDMIERGKVTLDDYELKLNLLSKMQNVKLDVEKTIDFIQKNAKKEEILNKLHHILEQI